MGDGLRSCLIIRFPLTAKTGSLENLLYLSMILHVKELCTKPKVIESLSSPDVVEGGDDRQVDARLVVQLAHLLGKRAADLALSSGSFEKEDGEPYEKGHEGPCQCEKGPSGVVGQEFEEGGQVGADIRGRESDVEEEEAQDSKHSGLESDC